MIKKLGKEDPAVSVSERSAYVEKLLVEHCSPTLASIKTGNLFSISYDNLSQLNEVVGIWNEFFQSKGVTVCILKKGGGRAMLYVYRRTKLEKDLKKRGVFRFLRSCGYESDDCGYAVERLKKRIAECDSFPHEIGLFLGYPLGDVEGFIKYGGKNSKLTGYWKVYVNEKEASETFRKFTKCREVYSKLWNEGKRSVIQLTVS
ncbi:MAG: DUF3793 family protein [Clostridia bacterium]|nr:DUF3793 family protein [Clostridia bacterium]